jgi:hypothetical protein
LFREDREILQVFTQLIRDPRWLPDFIPQLSSARFAAPHSAVQRPGRFFMDFFPNPGLACAAAGGGWWAWTGLSRNRFFLS